jgi:hypothetical protein
MAVQPVPVAIWTELSRLQKFTVKWGNILLISVVTTSVALLVVLNKHSAQ